MLTVSILAGHPGVDFIDRGGEDLTATGQSGSVGLEYSDFSGYGGYQRNGNLVRTVDLREFEGGDDWFFEFGVQGNPLQTGSYTLVISNESVLTPDQEEISFTSRLMILGLVVP